MSVHRINKDVHLLECPSFIPIPTYPSHRFQKFHWQLSQYNGRGGIYRQTLNIIRMSFKRSDFCWTPRLLEIIRASDEPILACNKFANGTSATSNVLTSMRPGGIQLPITSGCRWPVCQLCNCDKWITCWRGPSHRVNTIVSITSNS